MKFNGSSGVQVRMPSNLQDLAAYTSLKFYIQNPEPRSQQDEAEEGRFVLYLGSQEVRWGQRVEGALVAPMGDRAWTSTPHPLLEYLCGEHKQPLDAAVTLGGEWDRGCSSSAALGAPGRAPACPKCQHVALSLPEFRPLETTWALCSRIAECIGFTNWEMRSQPP